MFDLLLELCVSDAQAGRRGRGRGEKLKTQQTQMLKARDETMVGHNGTWLLRDPAHA
jgi:hypothetical protein